ncbi:MAG: hydrogenase iron-sulfur subunit [Candidatus Thorarchaeota archaeon]|nr:MAG: hydrogenase iron-sulfur subunit [Candidatus Thorarchaeota archaeon]
MTTRDHNAESSEIEVVSVDSELRIGVFPCMCGKNIGAVVDIDSLAEYAKTLPGVVFVQVNRYTCADPGQREIEETIKEHDLNRVVVASCSPTMHEDTFRKAVKAAGLNPYLCIMANIREHVSWVHRGDPEAATEKAKELVAMSVAKAATLEAQKEQDVPVTQAALVVGAGVAGMQAALDLADAGFKVNLVERESTIGGIMAILDKVFPQNDCSICILGPKMVDVGKHPNINLMTMAEVETISGYVGNFDVRVKQRARFVDMDKCTSCGDCVEVCPVDVPSRTDQNLTWQKAIQISFPQAVPSSYFIDPDTCLGMDLIRCGKCIDRCEQEAIVSSDQDRYIDFEVGVIILATGFNPANPEKIPRLGWGRYPNVITSLEFERLINAAGPTEGKLVRPSDLTKPTSVAIAQCVGSRNIDTTPACSNFCCAESVKCALLIKEHYPDTEVVIYYQDLRMHGKYFEDQYRKAREEGVKFVRGRVGEIQQYPKTKNLRVSVEDTTHNKLDLLDYDMVILSMGAEGQSGNFPLPISCTADSFYIESHPKLRPVDTSSAGVFICGGAESPKDIRDSVIQASAAAGRAAIILQKGRYPIEALSARIMQDKCNRCGTCVKRCPYGAISEDGTGKFTVMGALCQACGTCAGDCPNDAIYMPNFTNEQIEAQIEIALAEKPEEKILAFACAFCSYRGSDLAGVSRMQYPTNSRVIRSMCSGRYSTRFAQKAFELGAGAILYSGCHLPADCHFQTGNHWMAKREPRIRGWMKRNNIEDERFRVEWISAGEGKKWQTIMSEMAEVAERHKKSKLKPRKSSVKPKKKTATKAKPKSKAAAKLKKKTKSKSSGAKKIATKKKKGGK